MASAPRQNSALLIRRHISVSLSRFHSVETGLLILLPMPQSAISRMFFLLWLPIMEPAKWVRRHTDTMSLTADQKHIRCDGEGCEAVTPAPVALRPLLNRDDCAPQAAEGWLFVVRQGVSSHYCPACLEQALTRTATKEAG
jgi:hypothetical protein